MKVFEAVKFVFKRAFAIAPLLFASYLILSFILAFEAVIGLFFFKAAIDSVTNEKSFFGLSIITIIVLRLAFEVVYKIIDKYAEYLWNLLDLKQTIGNTEQFINKLSTLDLCNFENPQTYDKIWRSYNRIAWQLRFYLDVIIKFGTKIIQLSASIVIFFLASPINAILIMIANIIPVIVKTQIGNQTFNIYKADTEVRRKYEYSSTLVTSRETLVEVKQFQGFNFVKNKLLAIYAVFSGKQAKLFKKAWVRLTITEMLPILTIFLFLVTIALQLKNKLITTGSFVFLFSNIFLFDSALNQLSSYLSSLLSDSPFIHDAIDFYNIRPIIQFPAANPHKEQEWLYKTARPKITIDNLSFCYPNTDKFVLKNVNLEIPYGQNLALIGENGAGKTTLIKLLLRVYDPSVGTICINGINIKNIPEKVLFRTYSTLFQTFGKFYLTIRENMNLAAGEKLADQEYIKALKISNAWNYIKDFPRQLDQQLGANYTNGTDLSGGQWQQLAIARAIIRRSPVLILDEPTSAVDAKAEMEIFDRLIKETENNTVIFISHRFSTIKDAQRIVVLDRGQIIEDGNHQQLMKNGAKYAQLYTIQAERYDR